MYQLDTFTAQASDAQSIDAWREWCSSIHGALQISFGDQAFEGHTTRQRTDTYELVNWCSGEEVVARSRRHIRTDERGHYELLVPLHGDQHVGSASPEQQLTPGTIALLPIDSPFHLAHRRGASALTLIVPASRLDDRLSRSHCQTDLRILGDSGLPRVCRDLLVSLNTSREEISASQFDLICDQVVDLASIAMAGELDIAEETGTEAVFQAVRRHIRENVTDPDLSVATLATAVNWSGRYIQAALTRHGTTATELIRTERLELARIRLTSASFSGHNVAAVGASVGFGSASAFAAAFRRQFGVSPRDVRAGTSNSA